MTARTIREYVVASPRAMGILFTTLLLLSQVGAATAGNCGVVYGP